MKTIDIVRGKLPDDIFRKSFLSKLKLKPITPDILPLLFCIYLYNEELDTVCVAFLNSRMKIIKIKTMKRRDISIFDLINDEVKKCGASYFAVSHTHGTYPPSPSYEDIETTDRLRKYYTSKPKYIDHIIVSGYDYHSMENKFHEYTQE